MYILDIFLYTTNNNNVSTEYIDKLKHKGKSQVADDKSIARFYKNRNSQHSTSSDIF